MTTIELHMLDTARARYVDKHVPNVCRVLVFGSRNEQEWARARRRDDVRHVELLGKPGTASIMPVPVPEAIRLSTLHAAPLTQA
jgi:hypothetical protein